jgi:vancomycin resistance protein YoaR
MQESVKSAELSAGYGSDGRVVRRGGRGPWATVLAGVFALASAGLLGSYWMQVRSAGRVEASVPPPNGAAGDPAAAAQPVASAPRKAEAESFLDAEAKLAFDGKTITTTWRALGMELDPAGGDGSGPAIRLDRAKGLEALVAYKDSYDRPATDARMDLENRKVIPEQEGFGINVYESLATVEEAARAGKHEANLSGGTVVPKVTRAKLGNVDIEHVMGHFETHYPPIEKDRNYNLKLAAERVNGTILMPGEEFSFNAKVGDRTEKEGYRVAHVITAGEMVDGLAGGTCQVSTTLHGAAWFAGLELVESRPHSRPSAYVTMGLDATVVYPTTDVKLKNPYDFPVVIRYVVSQGTMKVEVLGKERPYDKIAFEREIIKETPYETITREDDTMPVGSTLIEQVGFPGYELWRRRHFYKGGQIVKTEKWRVRYPPTTEYVRIGINMDPNLPAPNQPKLHGPQPPGTNKVYKMFQ